MKESVVGKDRVVREYTEAEWLQVGEEVAVRALREAVNEKHLRYGSILVRPDPFFSELPENVSITVDVYKENAELEAIETFSRIFNRDVMDDTNVEVLMLVAVLARTMGGQKLKHRIDEWPEDWGNAVVIKIPKYGQIAWQYPDNCAPLFDSLPDFTGEFTGHNTGHKIDTILSFVHFYDMGGLRG